MLSKEALIVLHHYIGEGLPKTAIAAKLGINRRTVYRQLATGAAEPRYGPRPVRPSKLDPYQKYLAARLTAYPELSAVRLLTEIQALGYGGKYTTVKDHVRRLRPQMPLPIEQRFEVEPGQQAQFDFATFKTPFGKVYALLVVLSWSRVLWVRFVFHQDELTVLSGLHRAFRTFGGVPGTVLFDRMRTAVTGSDAAGAAVFNAELLRFAAITASSPARAVRTGPRPRGGWNGRWATYEGTSSMAGASVTWRISTPKQQPGYWRRPTPGFTARPARCRGNA